MKRASDGLARPLNQIASQPDAVKLRWGQWFFDRRVRSDGQRCLGQTGFWTPQLKVLGRAKGDCEYFAIAQYVTLKLMDIPSEKLRMTHVKAQIGGPQSPTSRPIGS
jgi:hypothetical protein